MVNKLHAQYSISRINILSYYPIFSLIYIKFFVLLLVVCAGLKMFFSHTPTTRYTPFYTLVQPAFCNLTRTFYTFSGTNYDAYIYFFKKYAYIPNGRAKILFCNVTLKDNRRN